MGRINEFEFTFLRSSGRDARKGMIEVLRELAEWRKVNKKYVSHNMVSKVAGLRKKLREFMAADDVKRVRVKHKRTGIAAVGKLPKQYKAADVERAIEGTRRKVSQTRKINRSVQPKYKDVFGMKVATVGGVHLKPATIADAAENSPIHNVHLIKNPTTEQNYLGIELEFQISYTGLANLEAELKKRRLGRYCNLVDDVSCGWEVRVLLPEVGFEPLLRSIMETISICGGKCDARCGGHVHFDMRRRNHKDVYTNLVRSMSLLEKLVRPDRVNNRYCYRNEHDDFDRQMKIAGENPRRRAINAHSFDRHKTLEIRMFQGTLDADEMINWIKFCLKIINHPKVFEKPLLAGAELYEQVVFSEAEKAKVLEMSLKYMQMKRGAQNV